MDYKSCKHIRIQIMKVVLNYDIIGLWQVLNDVFHTLLRYIEHLRVDPKMLFWNTEIKNIFLNYFRTKLQGYSWTDMFILILIGSTVNFSLSSLLCILHSSVVEPRIWLIFPLVNTTCQHKHALLWWFINVSVVQHVFRKRYCQVQ